jgi:hypothetical protein
VRRMEKGPDAWRVEASFNQGGHLSLGKTGWLAGWWLVFGKVVETNRVLPNKYVTVHTPPAASTCRYSERPPLPSSRSSSGTTPSYPFTGSHTPAGTPPAYYPLAHGPNSSEYLHLHHPHLHYPHSNPPSRLGRSVRFG